MKSKFRLIFGRFLVSSWMKKGHDRKIVRRVKRIDICKQSQKIGRCFLDFVAFSGFLQSLSPLIHLLWIIYLLQNLFYINEKYVENNSCPWWISSIAIRGTSLRCCLIPDQCNLLRGIENFSDATQSVFQVF